MPVFRKERRRNVPLPFEVSGMQKQQCIQQSNVDFDREAKHASLVGMFWAEDEPENLSLHSEITERRGHIS
jgi:hypothetical protein